MIGAHPPSDPDQNVDRRGQYSIPKSVKLLSWYLYYTVEQAVAAVCRFVTCRGWWWSGDPVDRT